MTPTRTLRYATAATLATLTLLAQAPTGTALLANTGVIVEPPDLCDDWDDSYEMTFDAPFQHNALAIIVAAAGGQNDATQGGSGTSGLTNAAVVDKGSMEYYVEIWKCQDRDFINQYRYIGKKWGFYGSGTVWSYDDAYYQEVVCYEGAEIDLGQATCEGWARVAPVYSDPNAQFGVFGFVASGVGQWDTTPELLSLLWDGNFDGCIDLFGLCQPVHVDIIASDLIPVA